MPHFICRWPGGDVLLASVESRQELDAILQERCEPGVCKVARYHGPLVLELKPDVPGVPRASAERFAPAAPACPAFQAAAATRLSTGDVDLLAADGSRQRVHKLVLQCRLPVLQGQPVPVQASQVRLSCVPDSRCLLSLVQFLYLDDVSSQESVTAALHCAALRCGLQRLVELCEAQFSQHLELQLVSWPGLDEAQRAGVLDSFIGWTLYAEQLGRRELHELCVHAMARHWAAAQSRPSWSSLSADTASLVQLVAASTAPPIIHRQVLPDGSAILPEPHNPGPAAAATAAAAAAAAAGQAGVQPPPPSTVSVDAEAFAAAGGRMTMWEWQQLQAFREAVSSSKSRPEASPLCLTATTSSSSSGDNSIRSFSAAAPGLSFSVKQPLLGPHKRLMDSVCRFAFPATHGLLTAGWKPAGTEQQQQGGDGVAPEASAAARAPGQQAAGSAAAGFAGLAAIAAAAQAARQPAGHQQAPTGSSGLCLPVPAPSTVHNRHVSGVQAAIASLGGASLPHQQQQAQPTGRAQPELQGRVSSSNASMPGSFPPSAALRMRVAAAAGAAAAPQQQQQQRGSLGEMLARLQARESWGSGVSSAGLGALVPPAQQQQQEKGRESWGSGVPPREHSGAGSLVSARGSEPSGSVITQLCRHLATGLEPAQAAQQQQHGHSEAGSDAGTAPDPQQQQNQPMLLEGAASVPGVGEADDGHHWRAACSQAGTDEAHQGVLDLPDMWQPPPAASNSHSSNVGGKAELWGAANVPTAAAPGGAAPSPGASAGGSSTQGSECPVSSMQRALVEDFVLYEEASAARQHVVGILVAIEQGDVAAGQRLLAPACAELIAATAPAVVPNRLAPLLSASGVIATAAAATAAGLPTADAAAAVTLSAAAEFCQQVHGVGKLLGSAASSRAALEATPLQLRQQRQRQQHLLLQGLQQVSSRLPWLSRLVQPTQQQTQGAATPASAAAGVQQSAAGEEKQAAQQQSDMDMQPQPAPSEGGIEPSAAAAAAEAVLQQDELRAAVVELIMQLPELLHGAPGPALLTQEQYRQRSSQAQQLAVQAMQLLAPGDAAGAAGSAAAAAAGADTSISNELAASGLLAAASAVMAATQGLQAGNAAGVMAQLQHQHASQLFASILESLRVPALAAAGTGHRPPGLELPSSAAAGAAAFASSGGSFLSRAAAFAAANRLAEGLVTGRQSFGASGAGSLGLTRGASIAGAGQLGAWRLPASGAAAAAGLFTPAGGMFAPTGAGALLSGGLLAEGGVAGDSILDDMLHSNVRRITCHGLYELCAALAAPADAPMPLATASPPQQQQQAAKALQMSEAPQEGEQEQEGMQLEGVCIGSLDDGNGSSLGVAAGAVAAAGNGLALAAAGAGGGGGSSRRSSNSSSMGLPSSSHKRRASSTDDENDRALKR